jgi:hypothetical protein
MEVLERWQDQHGEEGFAVLVRLSRGRYIGGYWKWDLFRGELLNARYDDKEAARELAHIVDRLMEIDAENEERSQEQFEAELAAEEEAAARLRHEEGR